MNARLKKLGLSDAGMRRIAQVNSEHKPPDVLVTTNLVEGDKVEHYRFGLGEVQRVDSTTYSVPLVHVFFYDYDEVIVIRNASELEAVNE